MLQTLRSIQECDPIRPSKIVPHLDRDTEAILLKTLAKEPEHRYQSVAELKGDLERRLAGRPILARGDSSLYLLRKIIARHRYTSTVAALLLVIVLGFLGFSLQLCLQLRQTNRELGAQKELSLGQTAQHARFAEMAVLADFLKAWHQSNWQSAGSLAKAFAPGTREALAVRFLADERPLAEKLPEFRRELQDDEPCFLEFIVAEHHLKDGATSEAAAAYQACLWYPDLEQKGPWLATWIKSRLHELADGAGSTRPPNAFCSRLGSRPALGGAPAVSQPRAAGLPAAGEGKGP